MKPNLALTEQDEKLIDQQLATGQFADATDVVRTGLRVLAEMQTGMDRWLDDEVVRRVTEAERDPSIMLPAEDVFAALEARHQELNAGAGAKK